MIRAPITPYCTERKPPNGYTGLPKQALNLTLKSIQSTKDS